MIGPLQCSYCNKPFLKYERWGWLKPNCLHKTKFLDDILGESSLNGEAEKRPIHNRCLKELDRKRGIERTQDGRGYAIA